MKKILLCTLLSLVTTIDCSQQANCMQIPQHAATELKNYILTKYYKKDLMAAARDGNALQMSRLLQKGVNVNAIIGWHGATTLIIAAKAGYMSVVTELLAKGAHVDTQDDCGYTALSLAANYGHISIVKELLDAGANPHIQDKYRCTALTYAANKSHILVMKELCRIGSNVNTQDMIGWTALMIAAEKNNLAVVELLLDADANVGLCDNTGRMAIEFTKDPKIKKLILDHTKRMADRAVTAMMKDMIL